MSTDVTGDVGAKGTSGAERDSAATEALDKWLSEHLRRFLRLRYIFTSTVGLLVCSLVATSVHGVAKLSISAGAVLFAILGVIVTWARDRVGQSDRREAAREADRRNTTLLEENVRLQTSEAAAVALAQDLMTTIAGGGLPLIQILGQMCQGKDTRQLLIERVLGAARKFTGTKSDTNRAAFYRCDGWDRLVCDSTCYRGRDAIPPRSEWRRSDIPLGRSVLEFVHGGGEPVRACDDVLAQPPMMFPVPKDTPYRSFVAVRVEIDSERYGMLAVDSSLPKGFAEKDKGTMLLLGALLAAGLALPRDSAA